MQGFNAFLTISSSAALSKYKPFGGGRKEESIGESERGLLGRLRKREEQERREVEEKRRRRNGERNRKYSKVKLAGRIPFIH